MIKSSADSQRLDPKLAAAITAAVQAYLDEEDSSLDAHTGGGLRAWRLAVRQQAGVFPLPRGASWKGRD